MANTGSVKIKFMANIGSTKIKCTPGKCSPLPSTVINLKFGAISDVILSRGRSRYFLCVLEENFMCPLWGNTSNCGQPLQSFFSTLSNLAQLQLPCQTMQHNIDRDEWQLTKGPTRPSKRLQLQFIVKWHADQMFKYHSYSLTSFPSLSAYSDLLSCFIT